MTVVFKRVACCSNADGKTQRSPPCITSESFTTPIRSFMARRKESRSAIFMSFKLGRPSVYLMMIGVVAGGGLEGKVGTPRSLKARGRPT